jgi:hypothetical protein
MSVGMRDPVCPTAEHATVDPSQGLRAALDRLQTASRGDVILDALLAEEFHNVRGAAGTSALSARDGRWSTDLGDALRLVPPDYNFSIGQRDGVCWAWIQPNDDWEPADHEARHDHPAGSGLVVASTGALALTCAALILHINRMSAP